MSSNEGGDYAVEELDPAMASRITRFTLEISEAQIELVAGIFVDQRAEVEPAGSRWETERETVIEATMKFWKAMRAVKKKQTASNFMGASPREISAVFRKAEGVGSIKATIIECHEYWCARDGIKGGPIDSHRKAVEECAMESFKGIKADPK